MAIYTHRSKHDQDEPDGPFNLHLVAGMTNVPQGESWHVLRPQGLDGWILNLTSKGSGCINLLDTQFQVKPGDALLFPPQHIHDYDRATDAEVWEHHWIYFRPRAHWQQWLEWPRQHQDILHSALNPDALAQCLALINQIQSTALSNSPMSQALAMNLLEQMLIHIHISHGHDLHQHHDPRLQQTRIYLEEHHTEDDCVDVISKHIGISTSRLQHIFKEEFGMSIIYYRNELRMLRAQQLLRSTGMPIRNIAHEVGYSDPLYFSRVFKQHMQATPSAFRDSLNS